MTAKQAALLQKAEASLKGAILLAEVELYDFAVARAYYTMFYLAQAFLAGKNLSFSSHTATIAAFGREFAKTGIVPTELHRHLIKAQDDRFQGDYLAQTTLTAKDAELQIERAERFLAVAREKLGD